VEKALCGFWDRPYSNDMSITFDILLAILGVLVAPLIYIGVISAKTKPAKAVQLLLGAALVFLFLTVWGNTGRDPLQWIYCYIHKEAKFCSDIHWPEVQIIPTRRVEPIWSPVLTSIQLDSWVTKLEKNPFGEIISPFARLLTIEVNEFPKDAKSPMRIEALVALSFAYVMFVGMPIHAIIGGIPFHTTRSERRRKEIDSKTATARRKILIKLISPVRILGAIYLSAVLYIQSVVRFVLWLQ
jgi:hypothetical protein